MARQKKNRRPRERNGRLISEEMIRSVVTTPSAFIFPFSCDEAWASWYGTMTTVLAIRKEIVDSNTRFDGFTRSDIKQMPNGMLISTVLLDHCRRIDLEASLGVERVAEMMPKANLATKTKEIIGAELYDRLMNRIEAGSSRDLMDLVESVLPQLGEVIDAGGYSQELVTAGVMLGTVLNVCDEHMSKLSDSRYEFSLDMVVHLYLQMIPVDAIRRCILENHPRFESLYPGSPELIDEFDPSSPIYGTDAYYAAPLSLSVAFTSMQRRLARAGDPVDHILETLQSFALATSPTSGFTEFAISNVISDANEDWEYLCDALRVLRADSGLLAAAGIDLDAALIPENAVESLNLNLEMVDRARVFRRAIQPLVENQAFTAQAYDLADEFEEVTSAISAAATNGKGDFELLGTLSRKGAELTERRTQLTAQALECAKDVMALSQGFVDALKAEETRPTLTADDCEKVPVVAICQDAVPTSAGRNEFEAELLEINTHLESDLKTAQAEIFRLTSANSALQSRIESPTGTLDQSLADLARRHVLGQRMSPEDLLRFYSHLAADRMVILESAWKSARHAENFAHTERLNDQLCKLVFEYLDQVRSGTPMGQAGKEMFAGAFAAKESQSVSQDTSMRAQREFLYNGETRFFEYRLRTGNGWGAVEGMRLYFDVIDDKMVIAYVGPHLDQPSTN